MHGIVERQSESQRALSLGGHEVHLHGPQEFTGHSFCDQYPLFM